MHHLMMILSFFNLNKNNPFIQRQRGTESNQCAYHTQHVTLQTRNPGTISMTSSAQAELSSTLSTVVLRQRTMQTGRQVSLSLFSLSRTTHTRTHAHALPQGQTGGRTWFPICVHRDRAAVKWEGGSHPTDLLKWT